MIDISNETPRNRIIAGEHGISITHDKYSPNTVDMLPIRRPIDILLVHWVVNNADVDAGIIRNANTVRIPPILTASTIPIPKVK